MKYFICFLSLMVASAALAKDLDELGKLRTIYDNSLRSEFQKVGKLYHDQLVELKKNYMEAQNLEAAVAVNKEIKLLRETHGKMDVKVPEPQEKASPLDGVWILVHGHTGKEVPRIFMGDKMLNEKGEWLRWSLKDDTVLVDWGLPKHWEKLKINPDKPDIIQVVNDKGLKFTYKRLKW